MKCIYCYREALTGKYVCNRCVHGKEKPKKEKNGRNSRSTG